MNIPFIQPKPYQVALAAGTLAGVVAGGVLGRGDSTSNIDTGIATVGAGAGGYVAGRYAGPQAKWFLAERAVGKMHNRQLQVLSDLKTGAILKYDQVQYLAESARIVQNAKTKVLGAAAPKPIFIAVGALAGAGLVGFGLTKVLSGIGDK